MIFCNQILSTFRRSWDKVNDSIFKIKMLWLYTWNTIKVTHVLKYTWWTSSWAITAATLCWLDEADSSGSYSRFVSRYVISPQFSIAPVPKSGIAILSVLKERDNDYQLLSFKSISLSSLCVFTACFAYHLGFWLTTVDCRLWYAFKKRTGLKQLIASALALLKLTEGRISCTCWRSVLGGDAMPSSRNVCIIHYLILAPEINTIVWGCAVGSKPPETISRIMMHDIVCHTVVLKVFIDMLTEVNPPWSEQHLLLCLAICGGHSFMVSNQYRLKWELQTQLNWHFLLQIMTTGFLCGLVKKYSWI